MRPNENPTQGRILKILKALSTNCTSATKFKKTLSFFLFLGNTSHGKGKSFFAFCCTIASFILHDVLVGVGSF